LDKGFTLSYQSEVTQDCPEGRSTTITFICDVDIPMGAPQLIGNVNNFSVPCDGKLFYINLDTNPFYIATFIWYSIAGCPVCRNQDYETVEGECVNGKQSVAYIRTAECNGDKTKVGGERNCDGIYTPGSIFLLTFSSN
jgi:hypothetical protein